MPSGALPSVKSLHALQYFFLLATPGGAHGAHQYPPVHGLVAPTYSPLFANGSVDLSGVDRQAEFLRATNVTTVFPCGTTGESVDLTVAERKLISEDSSAERWVKLGGFRV